MDDIACHGNESRITECPYSDTENCYGGEAAGVVCDIRDAEVIEAERREIAECFVEDVTYWGTKINATFPNLTSSKQCQEECARNDECSHFTFWPAEIANMFEDNQGRNRENWELYGFQNPYSFRIQILNIQ